MRQRSMLTAACALSRLECRPVCYSHSPAVLSDRFINFKGIDAGSIYHPLVQLIPSINHSVWKKYLQQSRVHRNLISFLECPLIPLVLSARGKNSFNFNLGSPLHILKTSMRSCLFLRSSSVHSFKQYNLSSYDFPSILLIIFVNLLWIFSMSSLSFL